MLQPRSTGAPFRLSTAKSCSGRSQIRSPIVFPQAGTRICDAKTRTSFSDETGESAGHAHCDGNRQHRYSIRLMTSGTVGRNSKLANASCGSTTNTASLMWESAGNKPVHRHRPSYDGNFNCTPSPRETHTIPGSVNLGIRPSSSQLKVMNLMLHHSQDMGSGCQAAASRHMG